MRATERQRKLRRRQAQKQEEDREGQT